MNDVRRKCIFGSKINSLNSFQFLILQISLHPIPLQKYTLSMASNWKKNVHMGLIINLSVFTCFSFLQ